MLHTTSRVMPVFAALAVIAAPAAGQSTLLRLTPEVGLVSRYRMSMEMFMDGPSLPFPAGTPFMKQEMLSTHTVTGARGAARELSMVIDSLSMSSPAMPGLLPQPEGLEGTTQQMVVDERGRIVSIDFVDDTTDPELRQVLEGVNQGMSGLGFEFPEEAVSVGDSWTANQDMELPGGPGQTLILTTASTYTLLRIENRGSGRHVVLGLASVMKGDASGIVSGMEGEANGEIVVDLDRGRMVSTSAKMTFNVAGPTGEAMTMTSRVELKLTN